MKALQVYLYSDMTMVSETTMSFPLGGKDIVVDKIMMRVKNRLPRLSLSRIFNQSD